MAEWREEAIFAKCPLCGAAVEKGAEHCPKCEAEMPEDAETNYWKCPKCGEAVLYFLDYCPKCNTSRTSNEGQSFQTLNGSGDANGEEAASAPISMWGYFGYEILYSIPILGQIILIYNALMAENDNVRNFARSYFCYLVVLAVMLMMFASRIGWFLMHLLR